MKVLLVNNFYYDRGGDCTYMFALKKLLENRGNEVIVFSMKHPLNFDSEYSQQFVSYINYDEEVRSKNISSGIKVLNRTIYSTEAKMNVEHLIKNERPDVAHLQNIHHHITPSIFYAFKKYNIPIIWTLHDFTLICPNTSFLAHGKICEKCHKRKYFWPLFVRCKKNSVGASMMAAAETSLHRLMMVNDLVDYFIAPSSFQTKKLVEYGFPESKIVHLKNFVDNSDTRQDEIIEEDYYIYVGRLSEEKGIKTLIDAAMKVDSLKLKIVGSGPLEKEMISYVKEKKAEKNIEFLGYQPHRNVVKLLKGCKFAVVPSECYENFPFAVIEAFAAGKPVIGTRVGGIPELIKNWETGLLIEFGDSDELRLKIKFLINHPEQTRKMGEAAKDLVDNELDADQHYNKLLEIYRKAIAKKALN